jgi:hypothetical protein
MLNRIKNNLSIKDRIIPVDYWQVTKSGKVLELRVTQSIDRDPKKYRLGIIQIGRIIYRINSFETRGSTKPRIQQFPNLSENQLAAIIYWPQLLKSEVDFTSLPTAQAEVTLPFISELAGKYNLSVKEQTSTGGIKSHQKNNKKSCYELSTVANQPFAWLKLGQFIEELKCCTDSHQQFSLDDILLLNGEKSSHKTEHESVNSYLQALIYLPESEKVIHKYI